MQTKNVATKLRDARTRTRNWGSESERVGDRHTFLEKERLLRAANMIPLAKDSTGFMKYPGLLPRLGC